MMKNKEIIEMARQAGLEIVVGESLDGKVKTVRMPSINLLETFAKLVAEKEREACALICDAVTQDMSLGPLEKYRAVEIAKLIRVRGQA
jgi:hypothetical protein